MRQRRAFTLIELLVVIAIIAILAAILFPVFARAKESANQATGMTHAKQLGTSLQLYLTDYDDRFPLAMSFDRSTRIWRRNSLISIPAGWRGGAFGGAREDEDNLMWANSIQPYAKNYGILSGPGVAQKRVSGVSYSSPAKPPQLGTFMMNGFLHRYPSSGVASPSQLPAIWAGFGRTALVGFSFSNPVLGCNLPESQSGSVCIYRPGERAQQGGVRAEMYVIDFDTSQWIYNNGTIVVHADTSAKWRRIGAQLRPARTNWRVDFFTDYDQRGVARAYWVDNLTLAYAWLFRPDYDFSL
jgi:prepilin-type N-terminal cleavage/methylation domain-containing protein